MRGVTSDKAAPAKPSAGKWSTINEKAEVPEQCFKGKFVEHDDMKTSTKCVVSIRYAASDTAAPAKPSASKWSTNERVEVPEHDFKGKFVEHDDMKTATKCRQVRGGFERRNIR